MFSQPADFRLQKICNMFKQNLWRHQMYPETLENNQKFEQSTIWAFNFPYLFRTKLILQGRKLLDFTSIRVELKDIVQCTELNVNLYTDTATTSVAVNNMLNLNKYLKSSMPH